MVDQEVENTLREIRERVLRMSESEADSPVASVSGAANGSNTKGASTTNEAMARIDAYLITTGRAWDRLPPLVSKRSGGLARLELWVKRRFKQATRWYSWEQVNFNAAVHHALRDTLDALLDLEQQMGQLQREMTEKLEAQSHQLEQNQVEMIKRRAENESQQAQIESQRAQIESQRAGMEAYWAQMQAEHQAGTLEVNARLTDLARELRERDEQRLEEQRVCFKQLSLEISEAEVLLDRARREIESRLDKLESSK